MQPKYQDMETELRLCPGGKLYYRKWFMDERKGEVFDVSDRPLRFLMYCCELDPAVTLRDVFDLIEANLSVKKQNGRPSRQRVSVSSSLLSDKALMSNCCDGKALKPPFNLHSLATQRLLSLDRAKTVYL